MRESQREGGGGGEGGRERETERGECTMILDLPSKDHSD